MSAGKKAPALRIPLFDALDWVLKGNAAVILAVAIAGKTYADLPNENDVAWALRQVESGDNWTMRGRRGELGAYQLMPATWRRYCTAPFENAADPVLGEIVARIHLLDVIYSLDKKGCAVTASAIARMWNPRAPRDYAERVQNLVNDRARSRAKGRRVKS